MFFEAVFQESNPTEGEVLKTGEFFLQVYRIYQLTKAAHFIERLMFAMKDVKATPGVVERGGAMVAMVSTFQILGFVCLWSLLTFLLRLFPSRPVAENHWCLYLDAVYISVSKMLFFFCACSKLSPCHNSVCFRKYQGAKGFHSPLKRRHCQPSLRLIN